MYNLIKSKIDRANSTFSLFCKGEKILVALSGGADSLTLLMALKEFFPENKLYACHVNHSLRGEEADRDMEFVKELCNSLSVPIEVLKTDVGAYAKEHRLSTELAARKIRYDYFEKVCKKHGIIKVATAHTLSDNAETVLFNMARGTGLKGLCGIPAKRPLTDDITIIRPLIYAERGEIEEYLRKKNQSYVTDSTNLTDDYTRNYIRHNIIPLLKNINPAFEESLGKMCASLYKASVFIDKNADSNITDKVSSLAELDDYMLSSIIAKLYGNKTGNSLLEKVHIDKIASLIKKCAVEKENRSYEVYLPGNMSAVIDKDELKFSPTVRRKKNSAYLYCFTLKNGLNLIENTNFAVGMWKNNEDAPHGFSQYFSLALDKSKIQGRLFIRNRRDGDKIVQGKMTKKLKELFTHKKVPCDIRNTLPLICDDSGIICIPGVCVCDNHKFSSIKEENKLYISIFTQTT